jgi:hypothetical protein
MPNWVTNKLIISADEESIREMKAQLAQPYEVGEAGEKEGAFLLWNIIRPLDLDAYFSNKTVQTSSDPSDLMDFVEKFNRDVAEKNDWYNWNLRNWGTKWDANSSVEWSTDPCMLFYGFDTAWSPPVQAIDKLAMQYPNAALTLTAIDEGMGFACELGWANGEQRYDVELTINHYLLVDLLGSCWCCDDGEPSEDYSCPPIERGESNA